LAAALIGGLCLAASTAATRPRLAPTVGAVPCQFHQMLVHQLKARGSTACAGGGTLIQHLRGAASVTSQPLRVVLATGLGIEPLEGQLSAGTTNLFKGVRYGLRRTGRFLRWSASLWAIWVLRACVFLLLALVTPLLGRGLVAIWKENGWPGVGNSLLLGLPVYVRLLLDRQAPLFGKIAVAFAIGYGVAARDLMPDAAFSRGSHRRPVRHNGGLSRIYPPVSALDGNRTRPARCEQP